MTEVTRLSSTVSRFTFGSLLVSLLNRETLCSSTVCTETSWSFNVRVLETWIPKIFSHLDSVITSSPLTLMDTLSEPAEPLGLIIKSLKGLNFELVTDLLNQGNSH